MDESKLELKVGALLLLALLGTLALLSLMGELSFGSGGTLKVDWGHTGNVVKGAPVKIAGVSVGRVETISLLPTRRDPAGDLMPVQMSLAISKEAIASLRTDAAVTISSQGALGEPYLELYPGVKPEPLPAGAAVRGVDSPRIDVVSNRLGQFLEKASKMLEEDPGAISGLITGIGGLSNNLNGTLAENRADVRLLVTELTATVKDLRAISALARTQLEPGGKANGAIDDAAATLKVLRSDVPVMSKEAQIALGGVAGLTGGFTDEDNKRLKLALAKYTAAGEKLDAIALRADRMLTKIEAGEGTLGKVIKDPQVYDDLRSLLSDLKSHPWKMLWKN